MAWSRARSCGLWLTPDWSASATASSSRRRKSSNASTYGTTLREVVDTNHHLWGAIMAAGDEWFVVEPRDITVLDISAKALDVTKQRLGARVHHVAGRVEVQALAVVDAPVLVHQAQQLGGLGLDAARALERLGAPEEGF